MVAASGMAGRRARVTSVLTAERVARLRLRLRRDALTRFFADCVFAMRSVIIAEACDNKRVSNTLHQR